MEGFLDYVIKKLVAHPGDVRIERVESEAAIEYRVTVHPDDNGRIIGRHGRTIAAIRTLAGTAAPRLGKHVTVELNDLPRPEPAPGSAPGPDPAPPA
jgi:hypothetical protein